jgi:cysteine-S-conjugate beta-lyase
VEFDRVIERRGTGSFKWELYPPDVLPLWVADMDFASPPPVVEALAAHAAHGIFGYSRVSESFIEAVQLHLARGHGWSVDPEWLVWLPGLVPGLNLACRAFAGEGDEVMTLTPVYPPFLEGPPAQGRRLLTVPCRFEGDRWRLPVEAMEAAVTPRTRVLLFCHPHNPLGRIWRREEVAEVVEFCRRHDLVLCSDEVHCDLQLDPVEHVPAATVDSAAAALTVTLMSPSKTYNLPGLNFAYAIVPDEGLRRRFRAAGEGLLSFPGGFALAAAEAAYREGGPWLAELLAYLRGNRDVLEDFVSTSLPRVSMAHVEATYLAWLDVRALGLEEPAAACTAAGVALSDGAAFGAPGYVRLNFACPRVTLEEALRRLEPVLGG